MGSYYKKKNWSASLSEDEHRRFEKVMDWFSEKGLIRSDSRYALIIFLLELAERVLFNEKLLEMLALLKRKGYVNGDDLISTIDILLSYSITRMPRDSRF